ncbi:hypothetical protein F4X90_16570 [Candidatus Poribacteria bacterium]|nr:hypothetical protein [Candidatus Poribacteria bacterium]
MSRENIGSVYISDLRGRSFDAEDYDNGIPRMVRGYFSEMACVIGECARVLKPNARLLIKNVTV